MIVDGRVIRTDYPESRQILLYRGELQYEEEGVQIIPVAKWLRGEMFECSNA